MNPAFSIVVFTTLAGYAQGLVVVLAFALLLGGLPVSVAPDLAAVATGAEVSSAASVAAAGSPSNFLSGALMVAEALLVIALASSFLHLGNKLKAWRAVMMWRTSWMSREVIVMPALMASVFAWWWAPGSALLAVATLVLAFALWYCTAMIYACLRFVQEWAHPLTPANFMFTGLASGLVLAGVLAIAMSQPAFARALAPWALVATIAAGVTRYASLVRNRNLRPKSTLQSATGVHSVQLRQIAMGMTAGSFNTREFFHRATEAGFRRVRGGFLVLAFALPALLLLPVLMGMQSVWFAILPVQLAGLLMERWFFFAEARHPQNLYYQRVA